MLEIMEVFSEPSQGLISSIRPKPRCMFLNSHHHSFLEKNGKSGLEMTIYYEWFSFTRDFIWNLYREVRLSFDSWRSWLNDFLDSCQLLNHILNYEITSLMKVLVFKIGSWKKMPVTSVPPWIDNPNVYSIKWIS